MNTDEYILLLDLDGTIVNTDDIYLKVWENIFKNKGFNHKIDKDYFNTFIKGKSDIGFLNDIFPNIDNNVIKEISYEKDKLFIEFLKKDNYDITLPGVIEFIQNNKDKKIAIVTSCNKKSAEFIINYIGIKDFINILISSDDCIKHKPDPYPYLLAMKNLNVSNEKCIIFEDSFSGYNSALKSNPLKIILICNENSCEDIINAKETKITDYLSLKFNKIIDKTKIKDDNNNLSIKLKKYLSFLSVKDIVKVQDNIKTGYICDIQQYKIIFNDKTLKDVIVKINNIDNTLSDIAEKLNLYNNEINFYENISKYININVPKSYGTLKINNKKKGIIMENILKYNGTFNINLNNNMECIINILKDISNLHCRYFMKKSSDQHFHNCIKKVKDINIYKEFINNKYQVFINKNLLLLSKKHIDILNYFFNNNERIINDLSTYPLSLCHGDLKSPNIFYEDFKYPIFLDWQYIHLNKGVSDIIFLLIESIEFDVHKTKTILGIYYQLIRDKGINYEIEEYKKDIKNTIGFFPFFVTIWFNSENSDKLLDKVFPIRFLKNFLKYAEFIYKDDEFI